MFELNCPDHTLCLSKSCLQLKLSEDCKVKVFDAWQACSAALILLSDVHLGPCCSVSILPHFSLHLFTCLCLSLSFTCLCLSSHPSPCLVTVGRLVLASHRLPPASRLTESVFAKTTTSMHVCTKLAHMWLEHIPQCCQSVELCFSSKQHQLDEAMFLFFFFLFLNVHFNICRPLH